MGDETSPERWQKCPCGTSVNVIAPEIIKATVARCGKCGHSFKAGSVEVDELVSALEGLLATEVPDCTREAFVRARSLLEKVKHGR